MIEEFKTLSDKMFEAGDGSLWGRIVALDKDIKKFFKLTSGDIMNYFAECQEKGLMLSDLAIIGIIQKRLGDKFED